MPGLQELTRFDVAGNRPYEAQELATDRSDDLRQRLAASGQLDVAAMQSMLRLPGGFDRGAVFQAWSKMRSSSQKRS